MSSYLQYIRKLNLWYLLALRDAANLNPAKASMDFHAPQDFVECVRELPLADLEQAAATNQILFKPVIGAQALRELSAMDDEAVQGLYCVLSTETA